MPTCNNEEQFKHAYQRLYTYLRCKHPEILQEYRQYMHEAENIIIRNIELAEIETP